MPPTSPRQTQDADGLSLGDGGLYRDGEVRLPRRAANKPSTRTPYQILCASLIDIDRTDACIGMPGGTAKSQPFLVENSPIELNIFVRSDVFLKKNSDICIALSTTYLSSGRILSADVTVGIQLDLIAPQRLPSELAYM